MECWPNPNSILFLLLFSLSIFGGCSNDSQLKADNRSPSVPPTLEQRREAIEQRTLKVTPESLERKQRSISILKAENVKFIEHLPVIETESESKRRTTEEVAQRAIALAIVAVKGEGIEQQIIDKLVKDYSAESLFTPKEKAFIRNPNPSLQERAQFSWRYEAYWLMLWSLGYVNTLKRPDSICDVPKAVAFLRDNGRDGFIKKARLRSQKEILDAADLIYRYHWAMTDARINSKDKPAGLDPGVVLERHYALNWLIGYMGQEWDDISTDT